MALSKLTLKPIIPGRQFCYKEVICYFKTWQTSVWGGGRGGSSFGEMAITLGEVCVHLTLFCFAEYVRIWHKLKFCKMNFSRSASFCSLPLKIDRLVFCTPTCDIPSVAKVGQVGRNAQKSSANALWSSSRIGGNWHMTKQSVQSFPKPRYVSTSDCLCWLIIYSNLIGSNYRYFKTGSQNNKSFRLTIMHYVQLSFLLEDDTIDATVSPC